MSYKVFPSTQSSFPADHPVRLALFDRDGTLITSKSGHRWASDGDDWVFQGPVPAVFQRYATEGWTVAIITNQSKWNNKGGESAQAKVSTVLDALFAVNGWAPWCLVATGPPSEALYRKPARGLCAVLLREMGNPTVSEAFYCGDAAGPDASRLEYRWAASDRDFAAATGVRFVTPDTIFGLSTAVPAVSQEIAVLVGNMGSGKSTTARALEAAGYVHCEQDKLKTPAAMKKAVRAALTAGKSVVVDATHATAETRAPYLSIGAELRIPVRILWHIRDGRPYNEVRTEGHVPAVAFALYSKRFEDPRLDGMPVEIIL
jgi:bifunctional polynucleotide phosphatase/kinase